MKIEIMYPELCCLYGDKGNTKFLQQCLPEAEFVYTQLNEKPHFLTEEIDLCCMYSMSEQSQELILNRLLPHKDAIVKTMESGKTLFLMTGNALELLGNYIQREDGEYTIPPRCNTSRPWYCDWHIYKHRQVIECFFQKLKWFRRIATRYDKLDDVFLSSVYLASILILLK